jgi:hypothetical protein
MVLNLRAFLGSAREAHDLNAHEEEEEEDKDDEGEEGEERGEEPSGRADKSRPVP